MRGAESSCDVLIVGAGPAGTAAAMHLQESGLSTCLCDKAAFPRFKSCGGMLEEQAFAAVAHTAPDAVIGRFSEVEIRMPQGPWHQVESATVLIDRTRFDRERLEHCRTMGVTIREGYAAVSCRQDPDRIITSFRNGRQIESRAVIAADGSGSLLRTQLRLPAGAMAATMQAEIPAGPEKRHRPLIRFFADHPGYGWIFPGAGRLNVGVYSLHNRGVKNLFHTFLQASGLPPCPGQGSFVLLRREDSPAGRGCLLLAGDAAGLANPLTGGGLQAALYSGRAAAAALIRQGTEQALLSYQGLLDRLAGRSFNQLSLAQRFYQSAHRHQTYEECLEAVRGR